jgi:TPP-dependent 2-oxoacid decarboxylase
LVFAKISRKALGTPLTSESIIKQLSATPHPEDMVKHVVARIKELFVQAKKPIMIVDACARRFHVLSETKALIEAAGVRESRAIFPLGAQTVQPGSLPQWRKQSLASNIRFSAAFTSATSPSQKSSS